MWTSEVIILKKFIPFIDVNSSLFLNYFFSLFKNDLFPLDPAVGCPQGLMACLLADARTRSLPDPAGSNSDAG